MTKETMQYDLKVLLKDKSDLEESINFMKDRLYCESVKLRGLAIEIEAIQYAIQREEIE